MKREPCASDKLKIERELLSQGFETIAGVDEVGRGPLAGPVVCAAVVMPLKEIEIIQGVDDSKKLSPKKRELLAKLIRERALAYTVYEVNEKIIDEINILQATFLAMRRAMDQLRVRPDIALIDGNRETDFGLPVQTIVKGDSLSANIAAASILAKVTRDRFMLEMDEKYPQYGFATHKGYGTRAHYAALREFGPCPIHRRTFLKNLHAE